MRLTFWGRLIFPLLSNFMRNLKMRKISILFLSLFREGSCLRDFDKRVDFLKMLQCCMEGKFSSRLIFFIVRGLPIGILSLKIYLYQNQGI